MDELVSQQQRTNELLAELIVTIKSSRVEPVVIEKPAVQNVQNYFEHSDTGRNKLSRKLLAASEWLSVNDPESKLTVREVARLANVSVGTAQAAMKLVRDERN